MSPISGFYKHEEDQSTKCWRKCIQTANFGPSDNQELTNTSTNSMDVVACEKPMYSFAAIH